MKKPASHSLFRQSILTIATTVAVLSSANIHSQESMIAGNHELMWTSYTGSSGFDKSNDIVADLSGNFYVTGFIAADNQTNWPYLNEYNGGLYDGYLNKLSYDGEIIWSLLIGGTGNDYGTSIAITPDGNILVAGNTTSTNTFDPNNSLSNYGGGLNDAFIMSVTTDGLPLWSRYIGGNGTESINSLHIGSNNEVIAGGRTSSSSTSYTSTLQSNYGGGASDGFICSLSEYGQMNWFTYLGGSSDDEIKSVSCDLNGNVIFCGFGVSIPMITAISPITAGGGTSDGFVASMIDSSSLSWACYVGGTDYDMIESLDVESTGNIVLTGCTASADLPMFDANNTTTAGNQNVFIVSFSPSGVFNWGRYFGGTGQEIPTDIHIDVFGNIYVSGHTSSTNIPHIEPFQIANQGGFDCFISKWNSSGDILWSSYSGGTQDDYGSHMTVDRMGKIYLTGHTFSPDMDMILQGTAYNSACEGYIMKMSDCDNPNMTIHTTDDSVFCYGGSATLIACGAIHFDWINTDTTMVTSVDTTMNAYVIGHNVLGCYGMSAKLPIETLPVPEIAIWSDGPTVFCGEGMAMLSAAGSDSLVWSTDMEGPELFVDTAGVYFAMGHGENGCRGVSESIEIIIHELPEVTMAIPINIMCISADPIPVIALPAGGVFEGPGTELQGMFNPQTAGGGVHDIYYTYLDSTGCFTSSQSVTVTVMYHPTLIFNAVDSMCVFDPAITLQGQPSGGVFEGDGVVGNIFTPASSGTGPQSIFYSFVDSNGCTNVTEHVINVESCTSIEKIPSLENRIVLFPNPANDQLTIQLNQHRNTSCNIYDGLGSLVTSFNINITSNISTQDLANGIYRIRFNDGEVVSVHQFVIQH